MSRTYTIPSDVAVTLAVAASEPWRSLLVLADACDDSGDALRAAGYRWLADMQKFPAGDRGLWWWMEPRPNNHLYHADATAPDLKGSASARLPWPVIQRIRTRCRPVIGRKAGEFDLIGEAWHAAALAVGEWLIPPASIHPGSVPG